jgi:hypothetical protein
VHAVREIRTASALGMRAAPLPALTRVEVDNLVCGAGRLRWICYLFAVASVAIAGLRRSISRGR